MIKNFSNEKTPVIGENWKRLREEDRINSVHKCFQENIL
jgi:hypothetical protein